MKPITLSPFAERFLTILIFAFLPASILTPHGLVWSTILGGMISLYYGKKEQLYPFPRSLMYCVLSFPIWGFLSILWADNIIAAFLMSTKVLCLLIFGIAWYRFLSSLQQDTRNTFIYALIAGLLLSIAMIILNVWGGGIWQQFWKRTTAKAFAQGSLIIALATWPTLLWILRRPYSFLTRTCLFLAFLLIIFWALLQMDCDTSYIGLLIGLIAFFATLILPRVTSWSMRLFIPLFIIIFPIISLYAFKPEYIQNYNTYTHSPSYIERLYIWNDVAESIKENPWLGVGMDGTISHKKRNMMREWSYTNEQGGIVKHTTERFGLHPHNAILQLWLELGLIGVILGVGLAHLLLSQIFRKNLPLLEKAISVGLFCSGFLTVWVNLGFWQNWWISSLWFIVSLTISSFNSTSFNDIKDIHERTH